MDRAGAPSRLAEAFGEAGRSLPRQKHMLSIEHRSQLIDQELGVPKAFTDAFPQYKPKFSSDLTEIEALQIQFENALGLTHDPSELLHRSYNVVIDRWHIEKLRSGGRGEVFYINEIRRNWEKNLRERLKASESVIKYSIIGNKLFSEDFPDEPFTKVLERGIEYRIRNGTPEPEREGWLGERAGFEKIKSKLADIKTKRGTKMTSLSPHGIADGTAYEGDFIDEFELVYDGIDVYVKLTRTSVDLNYEGYKKVALELDPHFFDEYDGRPLDAWYLSHPVEGAISELKKKGMLNERFEKVWNNPLLQALIDEYVREISAYQVDWHRVRLVFNAIVNQADKKETPISNVTRAMIEQAIHVMGRRTPIKIGGGGCPTNKGYDMGGETPLSEKYEGSAAKFAGEGYGEKCKCPEGNSDNHYHCVSCGKKYADETHKHERTKECPCGFKFGC